MFTLKCPICDNLSIDRYVYSHGTITCSENCANEVIQKVIKKQDIPPLELPLPTCEWCSAIITDIPDMYYNMLFCLVYCVSFYKDAHNIKTF